MTCLLVETDIESGLRWGELTELRVHDLDPTTGVLTVSRAVVQLTAKSRPDDVRFVVKDYPKDREGRRMRLAPHLVAHITQNGLGPDDLLRRPDGPHLRATASRARPATTPRTRTALRPR